MCACIDAIVKNSSDASSQFSSPPPAYVLEDEVSTKSHMDGRATQQPIHDPSSDVQVEVPLMQSLSTRGDDTLSTSPGLLSPVGKGEEYAFVHASPHATSSAENQMQHHDGAALKSHRASAQDISGDEVERHEPTYAPHDEEPFLLFSAFMFPTVQCEAKGCVSHDNKDGSPFSKASPRGPTVGGGKGDAPQPASAGNNSPAGQATPALPPNEPAP